MVDYSKQHITSTRRLDGMRAFSFMRNSAKYSMHQEGCIHHASLIPRSADNQRFDPKIRTRCIHHAPLIPRSACCAIVVVAVALAVSACSSSTSTHPQVRKTGTVTTSHASSSSKTSSISHGFLTPPSTSTGAISGGSTISGTVQGNLHFSFQVLRVVRGTSAQIKLDTLGWPSVRGVGETIDDPIPSGSVYVVVDFVQTTPSGTAALLPDNPNVSTFPVVLLVSPSVMHVGDTGQPGLWCKATGPVGVGIGVLSENVTGHTCGEENIQASGNTPTTTQSGEATNHIVVAWAVPDAVPTSALHLGWDTGTFHLDAHWSQSVPLTGHAHLTL